MELTPLQTRRKVWRDEMLSQQPWKDQLVCQSCSATCTQADDSTLSMYIHGFKLNFQIKLIEVFVEFFQVRSIIMLIS